MQRSINAPDWEWGTRRQCADWLGIDEEDFKTLVRTGRFPFASAPYGQKNPRWYWMDVVCYSHLVNRQSPPVMPKGGQHEADEDDDKKR